uniref:Uncharacterized protein n=1 Tax=Brassica oleracea var. oleracea TaxID=109376 RepID=A0A0D3DDT9_BRAOL
MKSLAFSLLRTVLDDPGATSQSDLPRSLPIQSDPLERHTKVARNHRPWSDFPERHLQVAPRYLLKPPGGDDLGSIEKYTKTLLRNSSLGF